MSPGNGLAHLDCAACGHPVFEHVLPRDSLAAEINLIEDWGPLPACIRKQPRPHKPPEPPDLYDFCPCPGYVPPVLFSYDQLLEVLRARHPDLALTAVTREAQRPHRATGQPRGRPRKDADAVVAP